MADETERFLEVAVSTARKADALIKDRVASGFVTHTKADGTFVTEVDTAVEQLMRREIAQAFPQHDVTGEELGSSEGQSAHRWYIDPIDGTLSFKLGLPFYGVILCLCRDGQPILSVIHHPAWNRLYHAVAGGGAYCNDQPISISDVAANQIVHEMIATGDAYAFELAGALDRYQQLQGAHPLVRTIPDCMGHTLAAQGSVGAMVDYYLNDWDFIATKLLVAEAGGDFVITGSKPLATGCVASNVIFGKPRVVAWLLEAVFG